MKTTSIRVSEEQQRKELRTTLSSTQQLLALDERLGVNVGATKERERLTSNKK